MELAEKNGQLERLTGKGFNGTFQLVDGANKTGAKFEDAFENACIAMNEPKDVSVSKLRDYLSVYHAEYNTDNKPKVLKTALDRAVDKGWITQVCIECILFAQCVSSDIRQGLLWYLSPVSPLLPKPKGALGQRLC